MTEENQNREQFGKVFQESWHRKGRKANLSEVSLEKIQKAAERGIRLDKVKSSSNKTTAEVSKVIIKGDDEK